MHSCLLLYVILPSDYLSIFFFEGLKIHADITLNSLKQEKSVELFRHIYTFLAGAAGIEPALAVLETVVLPLYDAPRARLIILNQSHINKNEFIL